MFFSADENVCLGCSIAEIVEGKTLTILCDEEIVAIFFMKDLAKLAELIMIVHCQYYYV